MVKWKKYLQTLGDVHAFDYPYMVCSRDPLLIDSACRCQKARAGGSKKPPDRLDKLIAVGILP